MEEEWRWLFPDLEEEVNAGKDVDPVKPQMQF